MSTNTNLPPIVFPEATEFLTKRPNARRGLSFKYILAVVYVFGGISALIALLSKFVAHPLFLQLTEDRRSYAQIAIKGMRHLNAKLSSMVSYNPPIRQSIAGERYTDSETQTYEEDTKTKSSNNTKDKVFSSVDEEADSKEESNPLKTHLTDLSDKSSIAETEDVKSDLEELNSMIMGLGFRGVTPKAIKLDSRPDSSPDIATDIKKEIRSIKGSLLSTRRVPTPN